MFTYTGDNTVGIVSASDLPNDGDLEQAASVDVAFQAIFDSLASLATGNPNFGGDPTFTGVPGFDNGFAVASGEVDFGGAGPVTFGLSTEVDFFSGLMHIKNHAILTVDDGGTLNFQAGGFVTGLPQLRPDAVFTVEGTSGHLSVISVQAFGEINVGTGGTINIGSGAQIDFAGTGELNNALMQNPTVPVGSVMGVLGSLDIVGGAFLNIDAGATALVSAPIITVPGTQGRWVPRVVPGVPTTGTFIYDVTLGGILLVPALTLAADSLIIELQCGGPNAPLAGDMLYISNAATWSASDPASRVDIINSTAVFVMTSASGHINIGPSSTSAYQGAWVMFDGTNWGWV